MSEPVPPTSNKLCPECGEQLASNAVLCVACGYHLQLQRRLKTSIEREAIQPEPQPKEFDPNPYSPPRVLPTKEDQPYQELTEADANWARVIVSDAQYMPWLLIASLCCCVIPMPLMLPYYAYRLANWTKLDAKYSELHSPNSFSPYGQLAADFQDARFRLILGIGFGGLFYVVILISGVVRLLELYL